MPLSYLDGMKLVPVLNTWKDKGVLFREKVFASFSLAHILFMIASR